MALRDASSPAVADVELVLRTRSGDAEAFGELWGRHHASGMAVARALTSSTAPDDLVREAYTRIHQAILKGGGPNGSFRAYLFASIRNAAASGRGADGSAADEIETGSADEALDRELIAQAFRSLPSRWQEVLWYTEMERMKPSEIAPLLGMSAGAVSQLSFRARYGLHEAWFQAHLRSVGRDSDSHWTIENLGAHGRGNLSARAQRRVDDHLETCPRCTIVATEADDVAEHLPVVLLPLVLGTSAGGAYLSSIDAGSDPAGAAASQPTAMPSSVVSGVIGTTAETASGGSAASAAAPDGRTGSILGIGAVVGAGSVALLVAGVVAAAAVVPTLISGAPSTSRPNAADPGSSSIASEVEPDESMNTDRPMVIRVEDGRARPAPRIPPAPVPHVPKATRPVIPAPVPATEPIAPAPSASPSPQPDPGVTPPPSPEPTPTPTPTPDPTPSPDPTPTPGDGSATGDGSMTGDETKPGGGTAPDDGTVHQGDPIIPRDETAPADGNPPQKTAE